jgi:hypothetical protein
VIDYPELLVDLGHGGVGEIPEWHDIADHVRNGTVSRGRSRELDRAQAGTGSLVLDNRLREFDPMFRDGPHFGNIRPGRRIRIRARWDNIVYPVFTGYATTWRQDYAPPQDATCTVEVADGFSLLNSRTVGDAFLQLDARTPLGTSALFDPAGMLSGERINNILSLAGWVDGRELDVGVSRTLPTGVNADSLVVQVTGRDPIPGEEFPAGDRLEFVSLVGSIVGDIQPSTALELLQMVTDTEGGLIFVKADGTFRFVDRHGSLNSAPDATFGDLAPELSYTALSLSEDEAMIRNDVTVQRTGGEPQIATDAGSITEFGDRSYSLTGLLLTNDYEALSRAQYIVSRYAQPWSRADKFGLVPAVDPDTLWPHALGHDVGDSILLRRRPQGIAPPIELLTRLEGIQHRFGPRSWDVGWSLTPSDAANADGSPTRWLQLDRDTPLGASRLAW